MKRVAAAGLGLCCVVLAVGGACREERESRTEVVRPVPGGALRLVPRFRPPGDGLLTEAQLDRFLRVRRAAKGRTDAENARALGIPEDEFAWTRARIVEALVVLDDRRVREAASETYAHALAQLRSARESTRNPAAVAEIEQQIVALEKERSGMRREETLPPALASNIRRVSARRAEIEAVAP